MHKFATFTTLAVTLALAGCTALFPTPPVPGDSLDTVVNKFGRPSAIYPSSQGQVLEYATGPMGQNTWMARIGADGRLNSFEQVLTGEKFATIAVGKSTREEVLHTLGRPAERSRIALRDYEVWSCRSKESGVWNSMMHVHFDKDGVVQMMQNGPDPMYEYNDNLRD